MKSKLIQLIGIFFVLILISSCGKVNHISVKDISEVKFRGLKQNVLLLSLEVVIDNPNTRNITVTNIEFKTWLNNREFGTFRTTNDIHLIPCSKSKYSVPVEIELRTVADAFRLVSSGSIEGILDRMEVEGFIKGKSFPVKRKVLIKRQPFKDLASTL